MKLMLVDDELRFLQTTAKLLQKKGYDVIKAASGQECLSLLDQRIVDVVVLDVKMPEMDGVETLKAIKRHHPLMEVIMLTGHATVEAAVEGLMSGASDFLMKPVAIEELIDKVKEAFSKRQAMEAKIRDVQTR